MKDLMNDKLFLKNAMLRCTAYKCSNSSKNKPEKTFLFFQKMNAIEKHGLLLYTEKWALFLRTFIYDPIIFMNLFR